MDGVGPRFVLALSLFVLGTGCSDDSTSTTFGQEITSASPTTGDDPSETTPDTTDPTDPTASTSAASTSGSDTTADTGGETSSPEPIRCESDADCRLINDCCDCGARHRDEPHSCDQPTCLVPVCQGRGLDAPEVECRVGVCRIAAVQCDSAIVACDSLPPECADGFLPRTELGCWGECIRAQYCNVVPDCSWCAADQGCVAGRGLDGNSVSCEVLPPECEREASCACLGEVCFDPSSCTDLDDGSISC